MKSIVLTGMMGSGKTTTAKIAAEKLNLQYLDVDTFIETQENHSINEIFNEKGEKYFREIEQKVIFENCKSNQIISLGGGAFNNEVTRKYLLENSFVIYLKTSPEVIFERIKNDTTRPLLKNNLSIKKINELIKAREIYYKLAHLCVITDNKSPNQIASEIIEWLKLK